MSLLFRHPLAPGGFVIPLGGGTVRPRPLIAATIGGAEKGPHLGGKLNMSVAAGNQTESCPFAAVCDTAFVRSRKFARWWPHSTLGYGDPQRPTEDRQLFP